jgi:hypothetical protein
MKLHGRSGSLTNAEEQALHTLWNNASLTVLPADKGNAIVILNTVDCKQHVIALLDNSVYKMLAADATQSV